MLLSSDMLAELRILVHGSHCASHSHDYGMEVAAVSRLGAQGGTCLGEIFASQVRESFEKAEDQKGRESATSKGRWCVVCENSNHPPTSLRGGGGNPSFLPRLPYPPTNPRDSTHARTHAPHARVPSLATPPRTIMTGRPSVLLAAGCGCLAAAAVATATSPGGLRAASEGLRRRRRATASSTSTSAAAAGPPPLEMGMDEDAFAAFLETESFFDLGRHLQASGGGPGRGCNGDADARAEAIADLVASIDGLSPEAADWVRTQDPSDIDPCLRPGEVSSRAALASVFFAAGGESWDSSEGWLGVGGVCTWYGVGCSADGTVVELNLGAFLCPADDM